MSIENTKAPRSKPESLFRLLTFAIASFSIASTSQQAEFHPFIIITLGFLVISLSVDYYPKSSRKQTVRNSDIHMAADTVILAATVAFVSFAPLPSSMICVAYLVTLLGYSSAYRSVFILVFLVTCGLSYIFLPFKVILSDTDTLVIFLILASYLAISIQYGRDKNVQLAEQLNSANKENADLAH